MLWPNQTRCGSPVVATLSSQPPPLGLDPRPHTARSQPLQLVLGCPDPDPLTYFY